MASLKGGDLYTALNVSAVTGLLDTYTGSNGVEGTAIFIDASIVPQDFDGDEYINYYLSEPYNSNLSYGYTARTVACHARLESASKNIAIAVSNTINREAITGGLMYCEILQTLPPADGTDVYNTPVTVIIKSE